MILRNLLYDSISYSNQALDIVNTKNHAKIKLGSLSTLFRFIKASGNKDELNDLITKNESFKKTDAKMMELLNNLLYLNIEIKDTEDINMCKAIEDMKKDAKKEGKQEGKQEAINENIKTMYSNGFDENMIAKALSLDINFVKKVLA